MPLSEAGRKAAHRTGLTLRDNGLVPQSVYVSHLQRTAQTYQEITRSFGYCVSQPQGDRRIGERGYGALEGLTRIEAEQICTKEELRSYKANLSARPPTAPALNSGQAETLEEVNKRVRLWWDEISPRHKACEAVLVVSHLNALRFLVAHVTRTHQRKWLETEIKNASGYLVESINGRSFVSALIGPNGLMAI